MPWNPRHLSAIQSLTASQARMIDIQECLNHLELIPCDPDAAKSLIGHIRWLALSADTALLASTNIFCLELHKLISAPRIEKKLKGATLQTLKKCCNLLAWQLEFTNPRTGILQMDRLEEMALLNNLKQSLKNNLDTTPDAFR